ncbi:hypothetical protein [Actinomadura hibisca]|uniref:hypothetical protein n=1 Tax=Actinomadura hibisca TaxID=68565 RepID=UPI000829A03D|nr:hypothetical protein [Actinomadura hibisca]
MNQQEQELYELEHSDRFQLHIQAAAVADGAWHMALALGNPGAGQQERFFEIRKRLERLYCKTNGWTPGDLTEYQRLFIAERIAVETVRFLAASVLAARNELTSDFPFKKWMTAHAQVEADIAEGGQLPRYEKTPLERARMLVMAVENASDEFEWLRYRLKGDASCLTEEQRDGLRGTLQGARGWIDEIVGLIGAVPAEGA